MSDKISYAQFYKCKHCKVGFHHDLKTVSLDEWRELVNHVDLDARITWHRCKQGVIGILEFMGYDIERESA